jgi:hypothetical protein
MFAFPDGIQYFLNRDADSGLKNSTVTVNIEGRVVKMWVMKEASDIASADPTSWFLISRSCKK